MYISLIAAYDQNRCIGKQNQLPFYIRKDLERFKKITMGHAVVMGRKTYESIKRPLEGRENIVISKTLPKELKGYKVFDDLEDGLNYAWKWTKDNKQLETFIIGGEQIYKQTIERAHRLYLTEIHGEVKGGDTYFPKFNEDDYREITREEDSDADTWFRYRVLEGYY